MLPPHPRQRIRRPSVLLTPVPPPSRSVVSRAVNNCGNGGFHAVPVLKRVRDISDVDDADSSVKRTDNMIVVT